MKNISRLGWTRDATDPSDVTYTFMPDVDTNITVSFDSGNHTFEAAVTDLFTYENDQRVRIQGKFSNNADHIQQILAAAERLTLRGEVDKQAFAVPLLG